MSDEDEDGDGESDVASSSYSLGCAVLTFA